MPEVKAPQDHKPKAATEASVPPFTFVALDGVTHEIPLASTASAKLDGRALRDAALGGDAGQLAYLFKMVEASDPGADTLDALYALSQDRMVEILQEWGDYGDGDGASLGE